MFREIVLLSVLLFGLSLAAIQRQPSADVERQYAGMSRGPQDILKDLNITSGDCEVDCNVADDAPNRCELKCGRNAAASGFEQAPAEFRRDVRGWVWSDGNCCCKTYFYLRCPRTINGYQVLHFGLGSQCWVEARCGYDCGELCPSRCTPHYTYRTVLVWANNAVRWQTYYHPSHCKCTRNKCGGALCPKKNLIVPFKG